MCSISGGVCGKVRILFMKYHTELQALSSTQAQSKHLRVYVKIKLLERGKLQTWRGLYLCEMLKTKS